MQEPPTGVSKDEPWYEILIHDDASTDGTTEIIKEYAAKYPDRIYPLYEAENQYSKGKAKEIDLYNYNRVLGKYIAYCEGDDYWTDAKKLQKQIDFMEAHPEYSITWTRCTHHDYEQNVNTADGCGYLFKNNEVEGVDVTLDMFFANWITQPLTMVFRAQYYSSEWRTRYRMYRDMHEMYHLLRLGKGYLFAFNSGVYTKHSDGIFGKVKLADACKTGLSIAEELYDKNHEESTSRFYESVLQWNIDKAKEIGENKYSLSWRLFRLNHNWKKLIKNIVRI